jgi:CxxC-x17-CxxC domain-containing protein
VVFTSKSLLKKFNTQYLLKKWIKKLKSFTARIADIEFYPALFEIIIIKKRQFYKHSGNCVKITTGFHAEHSLGSTERFLCSSGVYNCTVLYCMSNTMFGSNNFGGSRNFGGPRDSGPREMTKVTCSDCGKECEVPFKPTEGRPVYCRDCLPKHRKPRF